MSIEILPKLSFKYFVNLGLIPIITANIRCQIVKGT